MNPLPANEIAGEKKKRNVKKQKNKQNQETGTPTRTMERSSSPLSERSYAEAVTGSPKRYSPQPRAMPQAQNEANQMQVDPPQASSPGIPLSSMPMVPMQEQIEPEKHTNGTAPMEIEVDNTLGRASEDVNALLNNRGPFEGWKTVTPKKNRKKARKNTKPPTDSHKRPHTESPLKERQPKRQATINGSEMSDDEGNRQGSPSPSPALSVSALDYTDEEEIRAKTRQRASITPKAEVKPQANADPTSTYRGTPRVVRHRNISRTLLKPEI